MKDAVFTHNHPGGNSFSPEDIYLAAVYDIAEIRVVGKKYRHRLVRPAAGWSEQFWRSTIRPSLRKHQEDVTAELNDAIYKGRMTAEEAEQQYWHEIWSRVAKEIGFIYVRTEW